MFNEILVHLSPAVVFSICGLAAMLCSLALTGTIARLACRYGWVRKPTSSRHVHTKAIPRLGGVAIFLTTVAVPGICLMLFGSHGLAGHAVFALERVLLPATMLFIVGVVDDVRPLPAKLKLFCQVGAGLWLYLLGYSVLGVAVSPAHGSVLQMVEMFATIAWVVWITNAINLIDGLDGLAAGTSLFSLATIFIAACLHGSHVAALGAALLGGAVIGFLRHNFYPASIFLGDGGSLFIGFMMSALGLMGASQSGTPAIMTIALPALAFGLPLLEVVLSVSRRFLSGKRLFEPDRMHIHHRLLDRGLSHRQAVLMLYAVSGAFGLLALILVYPTWMGLLCSVTLLLLLGSVGVIKLGYAEFAELARLPRRTLQQRKVIANAVLINQTVRLLEQASCLEQIRGALEFGLPALCSAEIRFALFPRNGQGVTQGFRIRPEKATSSEIKFGGSASERTARLVMELESPEYRGSLEFVLAVCAEEMILNVHQLSAKLHPALDVALGRLMPAEAGIVRVGRVEYPVPALSLTDSLNTLRYVQ